MCVYGLHVYVFNSQLYTVSLLAVLRQLIQNVFYTLCCVRVGSGHARKQTCCLPKRTVPHRAGPRRHFVSIYDFRELEASQTANYEFVLIHDLIFSLRIQFNRVESRGKSIIIRRFSFCSIREPLDYIFRIDI